MLIPTVYILPAGSKIHLAHEVPNWWYSSQEVPLSLPVPVMQFEVIQYDTTEIRHWHNLDAWFQKHSDVRSGASHLSDDVPGS